MPFDGKIADYVETKPSIADVLRRARALVQEPGCWHQGSNGKANYQLSTPGNIYYEARCVGRAIIMAAGSGSWTEPPPALLFFRDTLPHSMHVASWNDNPETTHADVMAAFDRAIALAEAE